jgi:molybdenum cofactor cytidylyltransferase
MRAAIVLAAGRSTRFGRADKLFAPLDGVPLILHAIRAARAAPAVRVIVVAGCGAGRLRALLHREGVPGIAVIRVAQRDAPLSASLRAGITALRPVERDAFLFLGDMPGVDPTAAARLVRRLRPGIHIARPRYRGVPGHPVLARAIRTVKLPGGDAGLRADPPTVAWIEGGSACTVDVDRAADLARVRRRR